MPLGLTAVLWLTSNVALAGYRGCSEASANSRLFSYSIYSQMSQMCKRDTFSHLNTLRY